MKLQEGEEILHECYPERSILGIWFFTKCLVYVFIGTFVLLWSIGFFGGVFSVATEAKGIHPLSRWAIIFPIISTFILIASIWYISGLQKTFKYVITSRRCIFIGGIVRRTERSIPFHKITDVERSENIFERLLCISKVRVFTPGTASMNFGSFGRQSSEITFEGLIDSENISEAINNQVRLVREQSA